MARSPDAPRELFDRLTRQARLTAKTPDVAQVHNLRVAIRRFSQAMAMLPEETPGVASIHRKLKKTMTLAGAVRDADIAIKLVAKLKPAGAKGLKARLSRRRSESEKRLLDSLPELALRHAIRPPDGSLAQGAMLHAARRLFKRGAKADDSKGLHRLRIAVKKLRYTLELLSPSTDRLPQVARLQSALGAINDYETTRRLVEEESGPKKLAEQIEDKQRKKIRDFRRYWKSDFEGEENHRKWMADLSRTGKRAAAA
jgi:CHAD domain-containing protein